MGTLMQVQQTIQKPFKAWTPEEFEHAVRHVLYPKAEQLARKYLWHPIWNQEAREEAIQEAVLHVITNLDKGKFAPARGDLGGWAFQIIRRKMWKTCCRKSSQECTVPIDSIGIDPADSDDPARDFPITIVQLSECFDLLDTEHKEVLEFMLYTPDQEPTMADAMRYFNTTRKRIETRIARAIATLREIVTNLEE
jgi:DNA-directed RNA polymerase specialized sigma24 family protein